MTHPHPTPAPRGPLFTTALRIPGPFGEDELADALRLAHTVAIRDRGHDIQAVFAVMNEDCGTDLSQDQCTQIARAVLYFLCGIGALDTQDTISALNRWHLKNRRRQDVLAWAIAETLRRLWPPSSAA